MGNGKEMIGTGTGCRYGPIALDMMATGAIIRCMAKANLNTLTVIST